MPILQSKTTFEIEIIYENFHNYYEYVYYNQLSIILFQIVLLFVYCYSSLQVLVGY